MLRTRPSGSNFLSPLFNADSIIPTYYAYSAVAAELAAGFGKSLKCRIELASILNSPRFCQR